MHGPARGRARAVRRRSRRGDHRPLALHASDPGACGLRTSGPRLHNVAGRPILVGQSIIGYDTSRRAERSSPRPRVVPEAFARCFALLKRLLGAVGDQPCGRRGFGWMFHTLSWSGFRLPWSTGPATHYRQSRVTSAAPSDEARDRFRLTSLPLVLVVGSHEPRKNHLSILEAAEQLWGEGRSSSCCSWAARAGDVTTSQARSGELSTHGWPIQVYRRVSEESLWALYRLAAFSVFVSLLEGYGLPVAESLSCGTPVITSDYGSMAEIAAGGGAVHGRSPRRQTIAAGTCDRTATDSPSWPNSRSAAAPGHGRRGTTTQTSCGSTRRL